MAAKKMLDFFLSASEKIIWFACSPTDAKRGLSCDFPKMRQELYSAGFQTIALF